MLRAFSNIAPNGVNKSLGLTQALAKKSLEFLPGDGDVSFIFNLPLVLLPANQSGILKECSGKWHPILTLGLDGGKIVLTLLEEVIAL